MKTNRNAYLGQQVSTLDFVLLISGNYDFDEVIDASPDKQKKFYNQLCRNSSVQKQRCFSQILNRLNQNISDDPHNIEFPFSDVLCKKTSKNDELHLKYTIGDLISWVSDKYNLSDCLLADWVEEELKKRAVDNKSSDNDKGKDYIKIETLPKILQLMIEVCNEPEYDIDNPIYYEDVAKEKLDILAKKKGVYFGNNARTDKGLANINAKKVIEFIQKDKS